MNDIKKVATSAERLKKILQEKGLRQTDLVSMAQSYDESINRTDISRYCTGQYVPSKKKLYAIAAALGVSESWLLGFDVPREPSDTEQTYLEIKDFEQRRGRVNRRIQEYVGSNLSILFWRASEKDRNKIRTILEKYSDSAIYKNGNANGYLDAVEVGLIDIPKELD